MTDDKHPGDKRHHNIIASILSSIAWAITICVAIGLGASAYSGMVPPTTCKYAVVMVMTFPFWLVAAVCVLLLDLVWWRRQALVMFLALILCYPAIRDFTPLHLPKGELTGPERQRSFSIMTYNVMQFVNQEGYDPNITNPQLDYVLSMRPDIVCIEEAEFMHATTNNGITDEQLAELQIIYPYMFIDKEFAFLSRYPAETLPFDFPRTQFRSGDVKGWRVNLPGLSVNVFGVHFRSLSLTRDHRQLFREITDGEEVDRAGLSEVRHQLMPLLLSASLERADQIKLLEGYIRRYGGDNVIVCGDFNDPVGSYPLYRLEREADLKQVYTEVGCGPTVTYNANNFYFRIDHILYRGHFRPYSIIRGNLKASDHYPLTATFIIE